MEDYFGIKELYDVSLRCNFPTTIKGKKYEENEAIIKFDKIQIAPLTENKVRTSANGGYNNRQLVYWEETTEVNFSLSEGIISKIGLALLSNSKLFEKPEGALEPVNFNERLETNKNGEIKTKYSPINDNTLFIYKVETGERIKDFTIIDNIIQLGKPYEEYIIDYTFNYKGKSETLSVGQRLISGYLKLDGKVKFKDDCDGHIKTGIIKMPKVQLMSDLSMRLGSEVGPYIYRFGLKALPVGDRGKQYVCEIITLDNEIDSDL